MESNRNDFGMGDDDDWEDLGDGMFPQLKEK
jgi:hypothetical protein